MLQVSHILQQQENGVMSGQPDPAWVKSVFAVPRAHESGFHAKDFSSAPEFTPLRDLKSFSVYGLDFNIDVHNRVKLIEVNGINSGMAGFARTGSSSVDKYNQRHRADRALDYHLQQYGKKHLAMIGTVLSQFGMERFRLPIVKDLAVELLKATLKEPADHGVAAPHPKWIEDCSRFASHLCLLEEFLESKTITDGLLEPVREYKPKSYPLSRQGMADFNRYEAGARFAVLKPDGGAQGEGVEIIPSAELNEKMINPTRVVEPFIESTPIYCEETADVHDGCMRLVLVLERLDDESLRFKHFGGYWRLCPRPIGEYGTSEAMRANPHQNAIPQTAAQAYLEAVQPVAEKIVTVIEDRLLAGLTK